MKPSSPVGLIAGAGSFPLEIARAARKEGHHVVACGLRELAEPELETCVETVHWLPLGAFRVLFDLWREAGVTRFLMAGKVPKTFLWERRDAIALDDVALQIFAKLRDRADDSLMGAVADAIEEHGFELLDQAALTPDLLPGAGVLGKHEPTAAQWADVAYGWPIAKTLGGLDVGQSIVLQDRAILALEAIEGTDAAIARGCALASKAGPTGACILKVAKPGQDPRFDRPTIGMETIRRMVEGGAQLLAFEANATVVVNREALVRDADEAGIVVLGVDEESLAGRSDG